ncbi:MAG: RNA polymerase sigma factor [Lachnospiraceae bacterium]|nr:RNA polymerase sigma factor [Lachnospiraceae bacterium]
MNQKRFQTLYALHWDSLISFAKEHLQDCQLAEDIVHDTFLFFAEHYLSLTASGKEQSYGNTHGSALYQVLSQFIQQANQKTEQALLAYEENWSGSTSKDKTSDTLLFSFYSQNYVKDHYYNEHTKQVLSLLPKHEREPLILSTVYHLSSAEIGRVLSIKPATVRKRIERAKLHFQERYVCHSYATS